MDKIRVLHVLNGLGSGGAEALIMNLYRNIDQDRYIFDFLVRSQENNYKDELETLGSKIYIMPEFPRKCLQNRRKTISFLKRNATQYNIIHVHGNALLYVDVLKWAQNAGINARIFHSHSQSTAKSIYKTIHSINKRRISSLTEARLACSDAAGKWAFDDYKIINNGIDAEKYLFSNTRRDIVQKQLGIEGKIVYGHVGRFVRAKNHDFILNVFEKIAKKQHNAVLLLIGNGILEEHIKAAVKEKCLEEKVIMLGARNDVPELLQAMDFFLFPSLYEGLGLAAVEAQAAGLMTFVSEGVPEEVLITEDIRRLPIDSIDLWVDEIQSNQNYERKDNSVLVKNSGFDIKSSAKKLEEVYDNLVEQGEHK